MKKGGHRLGDGRKADSTGTSSFGNYASNLAFLEQTGLLRKSRKILEIGCGKGQLMRSLCDAGHDIIGIDMDPTLLINCRPGLTVCQGLGEQLPFVDQAFDLVLSFDVFEHIPDSDRHLSEVRRVLRSGGYYLLQTPNRWTNIIFEMIRWSRRYGIRRALDFLEPPQHCALHNYWQLRNRLNRHAFVVRYYDVAVVNEYFKRKVEMYCGRAGLLLLNSFSPDRLPLMLRTNFYVQARKAYHPDVASSQF